MTIKSGNLNTYHRHVHDSRNVGEPLECEVSHEVGHIGDDGASDQTPLVAMFMVCCKMAERIDVYSKSHLLS